MFLALTTTPQGKGSACKGRKLHTVMCSNVAGEAVVEHRPLCCCVVMPFVALPIWSLLQRCRGSTCGFKRKTVISFNTYTWGFQHTRPHSTHHNINVSRQRPKTPTRKKKELPVPWEELQSPSDVSSAESPFFEPGRI